MEGVSFEIQKIAMAAHHTKERPAWMDVPVPSNAVWAVHEVLDEGVFAEDGTKHCNGLPPNGLLAYFVSEVLAKQYIDYITQYWD